MVTREMCSGKTGLKVYNEQVSPKLLGDICFVPCVAIPDGSLARPYFIETIIWPE